MGSTRLRIQPFLLILLLIGCNTTFGQLTIHVTSTNPSCPTAIGHNFSSISDGTITATATGGTSPYRFILAQNLHYDTANNGYFPGLPAGGYYAVVRDSKDAMDYFPVVLAYTKPVPSLDYLVYYNTPSTCTSADGSILIFVSGGTPPYVYSMDGGVNFSPVDTFNNLTQGYYVGLVKDANGCLATNTITNGLGTLQQDCGVWCAAEYLGTTACGNDGKVTGAAAHYNFPFHDTDPWYFSYDGVNFHRPNDGLALDTVSDIGPGLQHIYVKDTTSGVVGESGFVVFKSCFIYITFVGVDASCHQRDGAITVIAANGVAPYTYTMDGINYQTSNTFSGLASGNYNVTVKDANGQVSSATGTVFNKCPTVTAAGTDEACGQKNGTITATGNKGTLPYQFSVDDINFQSGSQFTGLAAGVYNVTIKDVNGFEDSTYVTLNNNCLQLALNAANTTCGNNNGSITANGSSGMPPYQYSIDGINYQPGNTFSGLGAGTYTVTMKDATGLMTTTPVTITDAAGPILAGVIILPADCNNSGGSLTIQAKGGMPPYQFSTDGINYQLSNLFNVVPGEYGAYIKDANGCLIFQYPWTVGRLCLQTTIAAMDASCTSGDGTITVTASGGTAPYSYSLDGTNFQSDNVFTGLLAGDYSITTHDAGGLSTVRNITLHQICLSVDLTAIDATCGNSNGTITVTAAGGTSPYQYSMDGNNFQSGNVFLHVAQGQYSVTVRDANGFSGNTTANISNLSGPMISSVANTATCPNNDGSITFSGNGGTMPFTYSIDGIHFQNNGRFTGLASDIYTAIIKDINGCTDQQSVIVTLDNDLIIGAGNDTTVCQGAPASLNANATGGSFSWSPSVGLSDPSSSVTKAFPEVTTAYLLTVTWGICQQTSSVLVTVNPAPIAIAGPDTSICFGKSVQLNGSGGIVYSWSPSTYLDNSSAATPNVNDPARDITYELVVTDLNGCRSLQDAHTTVTVIPPPKLFAGDDTAVLVNQPLQLHAVDLNNSGFTLYAWYPADGLNNTAIQDPVAVIDETTTYSVTGSTPGGCEGTGSITIKVFSSIGIFVPSAFSPNGDGHNDILRAMPVGIREFNYFAVFNRFGQRIFYTTDPSRGWDGFLNGRPQNAGVYVWMAGGIEYRGTKIERQGTVVLLR